MSTYKQIITNDAEITVAQAKEVVAATRDFLTRSGLSQTALAGRIGVGASTLSVFLNNLGGDWQGIAWEIDTYLVREAARVARLGEYVETRVSKQILGAAKIVMTRGGISLVYGGSGIGKTTAINRLLETTNAPRLVYVSASTAGRSVKGMLLDIAAATGQSCYERSTHSVFSYVCERLQAASLLVIDESHKFIGRAGGEDCYDVLRDLLVRTSCPQIWIGAIDLVKHFNRRAEQGREPLAQILSRVTIAVDLNDLKDADGCIFNSSEVRKLIACWPLKPDAHALRYLVKLANLTNQGGLRLVRNLYAMASDIAGANKLPEVTQQAIDHAQSLLASRNARRMVKARLAQDEQELQQAMESQQPEARRAIA